MRKILRPNIFLDFFTVGNLLFHSILIFAHTFFAKMLFWLPRTTFAQYLLPKNYYVCHDRNTYLTQNSVYRKINIIVILQCTY